MVGNERVLRCHAFDWRIQMLEEFSSDSGSDLRAVAPAQRIFVGDDHAIGPPNRGGNRFPVIGIERAQIDQFDADVEFAFDTLRSLQCSRNRRSVSNQGHIIAWTDDSGFSEWNHVIGPGIWSTSKGFAIETLVLEEEHGIIAADRRPE